MVDPPRLTTPLDPCLPACVERTVARRRVWFQPLFAKLRALLVLRPPQRLPTPRASRAVVIGNFDGFHRGHQAVIEAASAGAPEREVWLLTFDPHPRRFFAPHLSHNELAGPQVGQRLASALGLTGTYTLTFDGELAGQSAQDFIAHWLVETMQPTTVVVGHDFRFGKGRQGDAAMLRAAGGFDVIEVPAFADEGGQIISSSRIRAALAQRELALANGLLGHRYFIAGTVEHGERRGRQLGYPTANITLPAGNPLAHGIYATTIRIGDRVHASVASYGRRPTFGDKPPLLEVHVFDFCGDLYGQSVEVAFHSFLRVELKFEGVEALIAQMDLDSFQARAALASAQPLSPLDLALGLVQPSALPA